MMVYTTHTMLDYLKAKGLRIQAVDLSYGEYPPMYVYEVLPDETISDAERERINKDLGGKR